MYRSPVGGGRALGQGGAARLVLRGRLYCIKRVCISRLMYIYIYIYNVFIYIYYVCIIQNTL